MLKRILIAFVVAIVFAIFIYFLLSERKIEEKEISFIPGDTTLLFNGSFDIGRGKNPVGWKYSGLKSEKIKNQWLDSSGINNSKCLAIFSEEEPMFWNHWFQEIKNPPANKWVKLTGFLKTENVNGQAYFSINAWKDEKTPLLQEHRGHIDGTKDWTEISFEVPIPESSKTIVVNAGLWGTGKAYFDNLSLTITQPPPLENNPVIKNPGFEDGLNYWKETCFPDEKVSFSVSSTEKKMGMFSAVITCSRPIEPPNFSSLNQLVIPTFFKGKNKIQLTAWMKTKDVSNYALIAVLFLNPDRGKYVFSTERLTGDTDWSLIHLETDIPKGTTAIYPHLGLVGGGTVWIDEVALISF